MLEEDQVTGPRRTCFADDVERRAPEPRQDVHRRPCLGRLLLRLLAVLPCAAIRPSPMSEPARLFILFRASIRGPV